MFILQCLSLKRNQKNKSIHSYTGKSSHAEISEVYSIIPYSFINSMRSFASLMEPEALLSAPVFFSPA